MSGQSEEDKYIKCKGCNCKYSNDDEHIKHKALDITYWAKENQNMRKV